MRNGGTGELIATLKSGLEISMPVMCCRFNPVQKEIFYASSACGSIFMCNTYTKEFSRFIFGRWITVIIRLDYFSIIFQFEFIYAELKNEVNTIDISTTGDYLVSGGKDATVRLYDARNTKVNIIKYLSLIIIVDKFSYSYVSIKFLLKYKIHKNNIFMSM